MYEFFKAKKVNGELSEQEYRKEIDKLAEEESDRRLDLELLLNDKEQTIDEELEKM